MGKISKNSEADQGWEGAVSLSLDSRDGDIGFPILPF